VLLAAMLALYIAMNTTLKIAKYTREYVAVNLALYATASRHSCNPLQSAAFGNHFQMR
jgi:hypothetical protein